MNRELLELLPLAAFTAIVFWVGLVLLFVVIP